MKSLCKCCGERGSLVPHWDRTTGTVCVECKVYLVIAETVLAEAGIVGAVIDSPVKHEGGAP